jgi:excisionase family DNA binding protein
MIVLTRGTETWLTTHEAAQRLGVSEQRVRFLLARRRLVGHKVGIMWLVSVASIEALLASRAQGPPGPRRKKRQRRR